ncbi:MAG TPA: hydantoinase/oxoprolinase family protein [Solirubrobacterales bacterium]|nr:hydantoinase/oxoprolinase family protein [Solirubrobacterales bacterium]
MRQRGRLVKQPIQLSHSGPVGGVVAAGDFAKELGLSNIITADLGGTSLDTALIRRGPARAYPARPHQSAPDRDVGVRLRKVRLAAGSQRLRRG